MTSKLKISGLYDLRTLKFLKEKGLGTFSFDFDPKSFNFLQGEQLRQMISQFYSPLDLYHLSFNRTTIPNLENTLNDFIQASSQDRKFLTNLIIELSEEELGTVEAINLPTLIRINKNSPVEKLVTLSNVKGFVIDYESLDLEHDQSTAFHFLSRVFLLKKKQPLRVDLKIPWDGNVLPSLFDFYPFDFIELTINRKVEVCYRNVNLDLLEKEMGFITQNL